MLGWFIPNEYTNLWYRKFATLFKVNDHPEVVVLKYFRFLTFYLHYIKLKSTSKNLARLSWSSWNSWTESFCVFFFNQNYNRSNNIIENWTIYFIFTPSPSFHNLFENRTLSSCLAKLNRQKVSVMKFISVFSKCIKYQFFPQNYRNTFISMYSYSERISKVTVKCC